MSDHKEKVIEELPKAQHKGRNNSKENVVLGSEKKTNVNTAVETIVTKFVKGLENNKVSVHSNFITDLQALIKTTKDIVGIKDALVVEYKKNFKFEYEPFKLIHDVQNIKMFEEANIIQLLIVRLAFDKDIGAEPQVIGKNVTRLVSLANELLDI